MKHQGGCLRVVRLGGHIALATCRRSATAMRERGALQADLVARTRALAFAVRRLAVAAARSITRLIERGVVPLLVRHRDLVETTCMRSNQGREAREWRARCFTWNVPRRRSRGAARGPSRAPRRTREARGRRSTRDVPCPSSACSWPPGHSLVRGASLTVARTAWIVRPTFHVERTMSGAHVVKGAPPVPPRLRVAH